MNYLLCTFSLLFFLSPQMLVAQQRGKINTDQVKMRKCDDVGCPYSRVLPKGTQCVIVGQGKSQSIDHYGNHNWLQVKVQGQVGFVFGALIDIEFVQKEELKLDTIGYIREENVNIRICPGLQGCDILFQIPKGSFCRVLGKTKHQDDLKTLGKHPWYFIEYQGQKGYVFGGLLTYQSGYLKIIESNVNILDRPKGQLVEIGEKNKTYQIVRQSKSSELIRPFGRHYWYEIASAGRTLGWVYGAYTNKKEAPVNCQCVDYVKNILGITGPTKNAFEWDEVLQGGIPVTIDTAEVFLTYEEIKDFSTVKKGDIAIFDKLHFEADNQYGHIGIVNEKIKKNKQGVRLIPIMGANHDVPLRLYRAANGCNNVSGKLYKLNNDVRFFRAPS